MWRASSFSSSSPSSLHLLHSSRPPPALPLSSFSSPSFSASLHSSSSSLLLHVLTWSLVAVVIVDSGWALQKSREFIVVAWIRLNGNSLRRMLASVLMHHLIYIRTMLNVKFLRSCWSNASLFLASRGCVCCIHHHDLFNAYEHQFIWQRFPLMLLCTLLPPVLLKMMTMMKVSQVWRLGGWVGVASSWNNSASLLPGNSDARGGSAIETECEDEDDEVGDIMFLLNNNKKIGSLGVEMSQLAFSCLSLPL